MSEVTLTAEPRSTTGSAPARRMRAEDQIPAVVYGKNYEAASIVVSRADLRHALSTDAGANALLSLELEGQTLTAIAREVQRHPVRRDVIHVDFVVVDPANPIELSVPIVLVGEAKQVTVNGGMTEQRLNSLKVRVRPDSIPDSIPVDISGMRLDKSLLVKDLELPEGVVSLSRPQQAVVTAELTRAAMVSARDAGAAATEE